MSVTRHVALVLLVTLIVPELALSEVPDWLSDIDAVVSEYGERRVATDLDCPWELAHYLLAFGAQAQVNCAKGRTDLVGYLLTSATGKGAALFLRGDRGDLVPKTDVPPKQTYQDHRNQLLACVAIASGSVGKPASGPASVSAEVWQAMLRGAWDDYALSDEPSWTLVCYLRYGPDLPASRAELLKRIENMVQLLVDTESRSSLACRGSHALYALAEYVNSPYGQPLDGELNSIARRRLESGVRDFLESVAVRRSASVAARSSLASMGDMISDEGHSLEWIVAYLPESRLQEEDMVAAVQHLANLLRGAAPFELSPPGATLHAIHGLRSYSAKVRHVGIAGRVEQTTSEVK